MLEHVGEDTHPPGSGVNDGRLAAETGAYAYCDHVHALTRRHTLPS